MPDDGVLDLGIALFRALARLGWRGAAARRSAAQLGAAQRIIVVINRITAAQRSTNSTRQRLDSSSAPTASQRQASACQASLFSASARQSLLRRSARSRSRSTISISILIHPLIHSLNQSASPPWLPPRTLILLQGLASSFVTSPHLHAFSPFSARPPGSIAPPRPDLIALTCSSDCTCTSTRADCPAPACTIVHRSQQTPLPCRAVLPSYPHRAVPHSPTSSSDAHPWPLHPTQPRPDHLDPHSPHCLLVISSTSQLPRLLDTSKL
ncbi:hypothetical protein L1887_61821 [Cichorium endivia]|nr:hypothetical protein L1887_61821 [Cichorium endivia]